MAGSYPDYPSWRFPYDRDGTQVFKISSTNAITQVSAADILKMNNEDNDHYTSNSVVEGSSLVFIFPELRDIDAFLYVHAATGQNACVTQVSTSANTTNGLDGTWTNLGASFTPAANTNVSPTYRTGITTAAANGVKAVKFTFTGNSSRLALVAALHLFGEIPAGQNPNRLILWHPTLDQRVGPAYFDWGDVRRGEAASDRTFRVKNNSATLTANGVSTSLQVLTDSSPTLLAGQHSLSLDGTSFAQTQSIGSLAPGAISGTVTLRRTIASTAQLSVWALRVVAEATSWT